MHITPVSKVAACRPIADWLKQLASPKGKMLAKLQSIYGSDPGRLSARVKIWKDALAAAAKVFGPKAEVFVVRSAGRINLMGMHVDHRGGSVNPITIGDELFVVRPRTDDAIVMHDSNAAMFPSRTLWLSAILPKNTKVADWDKWSMDEFNRRKAAGTNADWSNYVMAPIVYLQHLLTDDKGKFDPALKGMDVLVHNALPMAAGLSSSSAMVVGIGKAVLHINGIEMSNSEFIDLCQYGEWYVGTRGGAGDHAAISFGQYGKVSHLGSHPLTISDAPFPESHAVVLCNSMKEAKKTAGARDFYNERVACYEVGLLLLKKRWPQYCGQLGRIRDLQPTLLGVDDATVLEIIKALPDPINRADVLAQLPEERPRLEKVFASHADPSYGYQVRRVVLYGVAECMRSEMFSLRLRAGDMKGLRDIVRSSHDGDRVSELRGGQRVKIDHYLSEKDYDCLIGDLRSKDAKRSEPATLWRQPGGYNASCEEIDEMVDIALEIDGVVGGRIVGAGLGGCMIVFCEKNRTDEVIARMEQRYYKPRGLDPAARACFPTGGAGVVDLDSLS